jgi:hypothetical protein
MFKQIFSPKIRLNVSVLPEFSLSVVVGNLSFKCGPVWRFPNVADVKKSSQLFVKINHDL